MKASLSVNIKMSAGTKRSNADDDNNDETTANTNTGMEIYEPVRISNIHNFNTISNRLLVPFSYLLIAFCCLFFVSRVCTCVFSSVTWRGQIMVL